MNDKELEQSAEEVDAYVKISHPKHRMFWQAMRVLAKDEIKKRESYKNKFVF